MKIVRDLITNKDLTVVSKTQTVLQAAQIMTEKKIGAVPVLEGDRVTGIFSERDIMTRVVAANLNPATTLVEQVMTKDLVIGAPEESIDQVEQKMKQYNIRHLPIVSGNKLVGIISLRDLLSAELDEKVEEIRMMTAYIHYIPPTFES
jgi:CBS domain-containing protein